MALFMDKSSATPAIGETKGSQGSLGIGSMVHQLLLVFLVPFMQSMQQVHCDISFLVHGTSMYTHRYIYIYPDDGFI